MEVEHVKAPRIKKDKKEMSQFEKFVAEGNEKADELAKAGAMLDEGFMAEARAKTVQQERESGSVCGLAIRSEFSLFGRRVERLKKSEETMHRTEWCANASKYRVHEVWKEKEK